MACHIVTLAASNSIMQAFISFISNQLQNKNFSLLPLTLLLLSPCGGGNNRTTLTHFVDSILYRRNQNYRNLGQFTQISNAKQLSHLPTMASGHAVSFSLIRNSSVRVLPPHIYFVAEWNSVLAAHSIEKITFDSNVSFQKTLSQLLVDLQTSLSAQQFSLGVFLL